MNTLLKVLKYQSKDAARSRWLIAYAAFFMLVAEVLLRFSGDPMKVQLSLVSVVLFLVPLVSIVFGTVYLYNARWPSASRSRWFSRSSAGSARRSSFTAAMHPPTARSHGS